MAGVPLLLGFIAKEADYDALLHADLGRRPQRRRRGRGRAGSVLTFAYSARLLWGGFGHRASPTSRDRPRRPGRWWRRRARGLVGPGRRARRGHRRARGAPALRRRPHRRGAPGPSTAAAPAATSTLWHGVTIALVAVGPDARPRASRSSSCSRTGAAPQVARSCTPSRGHRGVRRPARAASTGSRTASPAIVQNGSLPIYAGVILLDRRGRARRRAADVGTHGPGWPAVRRQPRAGRRGGRPARRRRSPRSVAAAGSRRRCSSAPPATRWRGCSSSRAHPTWRSPRRRSRRSSTVLFVLVLRRLPDRFERTSTAAPRSCGP